MRLRTRLRRLLGPAHWTALIGMLVLAVLAMAAVVPSLFAPGNPLVGDPFKGLQPPSSRHPLGTDDVGRDLYTRVVHGASLSLRAGFEVISLSALIGIPFGFAGGYLGGWADDLIMRVSDVFLAFP